MGRVRPQFRRIRDQYFLHRPDELDRAGLVFVATRLSMAFFDTNRLPRRDVNEIIRSALERQGRAGDRDSVFVARDRLHDLGHIWSVSEESRKFFEPGISSLMRYVARCEGIDVGMEDP